MFRNRNLKENYYDKYMDELDIFDQEFDREISKEEFEFGDNIFSILQELVDTELTEEFTSNVGLTYHFNRHCIKPGRRSTRQTVYYDFTDESDYSQYENYLSNETIKIVNNKTGLFINDLYDTAKILKAFRKLFEGNKTLVFGLGCGFHNTTGSIRICLHSFAADYTTNYLNNTIDVLIQAPDNKTISLFAVDANYLENKINSEIRNIPKAIRLQINH